MLSAEQQKIIEESLWVVNTALKRQGLSTNEDFRQSAILYMCGCLERYDETKSVAWTTFAYKSVYLFIKRLKRKQQTRESMEIHDDLLYGMIFAEEKPTLNETDFLFVHILNMCSARERQILELKLKGYTCQEIGSSLGCSTSTINKFMGKLKNKVRCLMETGEFVPK